MSAPIPLRLDFDATMLRSLAKKSKDGPQARWLLALKLGGEPLVYEMAHFYTKKADRKRSRK
jgi:hypothetical protein